MKLPKQAVNKIRAVISRTDPDLCFVDNLFKTQGFSTVLELSIVADCRLYYKVCYRFYSNFNSVYKRLKR